MDKATREKARERRWYIGAMNDALFIIDQPPRPSPKDYDTGTLHDTNSISRAIDEANAKLIVAAHNSALDAAISDSARLRARVSELEAGLANEREECAEVCDELMRTTADLGIRSGAVDCAYLIRARTASRR